MDYFQETMRCHSLSLVKRECQASKTQICVCNVGGHSWASLRPSCPEPLPTVLQWGKRHPPHSFMSIFVKFAFTKKA